MAAIFPDEGLDIVLALVTGNQPAPAGLYLGMFTSQTPTTVPARTAVLATQTGVSEAKGVGYERLLITPADWGAAVTNGLGRRRTSIQKVFPAVGASGWGNVNGFFVADSPTGGRALFYANFADQTAKAMNPGAVEKITPSLQFDG